MAYTGYVHNIAFLGKKLDLSALGRIGEKTCISHDRIGVVFRDFRDFLLRSRGGNDVALSEAGSLAAESSQ
jgi:hypothetical protein